MPQISSEFGAACAVLGLSATDVAERLDVRPDTARSWITGRRTPPPAAWAALALIYKAQSEVVGGAAAETEQRVLSALARLRSTPL